MSKTKTIHFYEDPGHGWGKVGLKELVDLGIDQEISTYSYQRNGWVFLEEDLDLGIYLQALRARGIEPKFVEHHTNRVSRIRSYDHYHRPMPA